MRNKTKRKRRNPHVAALMLDTAHVILCAGIVVFAVVIFLNPTEFQHFFPVVFGLAALMQFLHGVPKIMVYRRSHGGDKSSLVAGVLLCILGLLLGVVAVVSGVTIWG